jgi:hypothetical protein
MFFSFLHFESNFRFRAVLGQIQTWPCAQPSHHFVRVGSLSLWRRAQFDITLARPSHHSALVGLSRCGAGLILTSLSRPSHHFACVCACWIALVVGRYFALLYTQALLRNRFYTQPANLNTQETFARPRFFTQHFYTQDLLRKQTFPRKLLHTETLTHRCLWTLLHSGALANTLRTGAVAPAFLHRSFWAQKA